MVPGNCFHDNTDTPGTVTSDPPDIQTVDGTCGGPAPGDPSLAAQIVCASGIQQPSGLPPCPDNPPTSYPQTTRIKMLPLPPQATHAEPLRGVPANPWCPGGGSGHSGSVAVGLRAKPGGHMPNTQRDKLSSL